MKTRQLYIISGCNGAGKTTASYTVLPEILLCKRICQCRRNSQRTNRLSIRKSMAIEAGRLMLKTY